MQFVPRPLLLAFGLACCTALAAQTVPVRNVPSLVLHNDSSLKAVLGFRMQDRFSYMHTAGAGTEADAYDFQVRRFRLRLDGHAITPRLTYKVQLGLSDRDLAVGDGTSTTSPLMDAIVFYAIGSTTRIGFGQGKLPGGRLALISSGAMELPERALANGSFTAERDKGLQLEQNLASGTRPISLRLAITQGEGRAGESRNTGLCYTGRLEWMPFGKFQGDGAYSEGDLHYEPTPKLAVAVAYNSDRNARRARAQAGPWLPADQRRTIGTLYADAIFKHKGWAWLGEFDRRLADGSAWAEDTVAHVAVAVNEGWGLTNQVSRMVGKRSQVTVRHSMVKADSAVRAAYGDRDEAFLGWAYYLNGHRIKLQSAAFYIWGDGEMNPEHPGNQYGMMFQVELGI